MIIKRDDDQFKMPVTSAFISYGFLFSAHIPSSKVVETNISKLIKELHLPFHTLPGIAQAWSSGKPKCKARGSLGMMGGKLWQESVATLNNKIVIPVVSSFTCAHQNLWFVVLDISECKEIPGG